MTMLQIAADHNLDVTQQLGCTPSTDPPTAVTLELAAAGFLEWLSRTPDLKSATKTGYRIDFLQFMAAMSPFGPIRLRELRERHVEVWKSGMSHLGPATIRRKLVALSRFFDWARMEELVVRNPVEFVKKPKKARRVMTAVTLDHYQLLLAACPTRRERAMLGCFFWAGLRRHEVADLNVGSVDLASGSILVRGKGDKERLLPIARNLRVLLDEYLPARSGASFGDALFLSRDDARVSDKVLQNWFTVLLRRAGLGEQGYTLHSCRRGISSLMHDQDIPLLFIKDFLGHEDPNTTAMYIQRTIRQLGDRMNANPIFGDESVETSAAYHLSRLEGKFDDLTAAVVALLERGSLPREDGVYPLHEALQLGGSVGHDGHAVADEKPSQ